MSSYISYFTPQSWTRAQKNKSDLEATNPTNPVLNDEDEQFLSKITSQEGIAPPLPERKTVISDDGTADVKDEEVTEVDEAVVPEKAEEEKVNPSLETNDSPAADKTVEPAEITEEQKNDETRLHGTEHIEDAAKDDAAAAKTADDKTEEDKTEETKADETKTDEPKNEEDKTDEAKAAGDKKTEEDDSKMTKSWASYLPSLPTLTKKKDSDAAKKEDDKKEEESKPQDSKAEEATTPAPPTSPKSRKQKRDPFPSQEEAEAATAEGTKHAEAATTAAAPSSAPQGRQTEDVSNSSTRTWSSYIPNLSRGTPQEQASASLAAAASSVRKGKEAETPTKNPDGSQTEDEKEVSVLLDHLNLSAINNRVFSFSAGSQKIYQDFTVVLKDIVNGGPTAYEDLEKLIKENEKHLDQMFGNMPPFVQTLVKSLPAKFASSLAPEVMAAMSEKPGHDMKARMATASFSTADGSLNSGANLKIPESSNTKKQKRKVPGMKSLVSEKGAVASMLRSILTFLKTRFPAFVTGTNVLMSLAVFILLFVFWYCHKRGREVRLLNEEKARSAQVSEAESSSDEAEDDEKDEFSQKSSTNEDKEDVEIGTATKTENEDEEKQESAVDQKLDEQEPEDVVKDEADAQGDTKIDAEDSADADSILKKEGEPESGIHG
ncbi:hypothetical protein BDV97DRAFT_149075 [Delphinella strobiligena]|nr:hypothetical protein BDV97DRAFT_149075 [Delphinella strobiligena]